MSGQRDASGGGENTTGDSAQPPTAMPEENHDPDTGHGREVVEQQPCAGAASVPRSMQATSVESTGSHSGSRDESMECMNEDGTLSFPCRRPRTADATTQSEQETQERPAKCTCLESRRLGHGFQDINTTAPPLQLSAEVVSGVPGAPLFGAAATQTGAGIIENASQDEMIKKQRSSHKDWHNHPLCQGDKEGSSQLLYGDRRPRIHELTDTTQVRDQMFERSYGMLHARAATSSAIVFEDAPITVPTSGMSSLPENRSAPPQFEVLIPRAPEGPEDDGAESRADALNYAVSDELRSIYETIQSRWEEVSDQLRADLYARYDQFLQECERRLQSRPGSSDRSRLHEDMEDALQQFIAETKDQFRTACVDFDEWRVAYLDSEVQSSRSALRLGAEFRVQAAVFRYEVLDSLPDMERRTRARAAELWQELVEHTDLDVDALFGELEDE